MAIKDSRLLSTIGLGTLLAAITGCPSADPMDGDGAALSITLDVIAAAANPREGLEDILWALRNSQEFVFNH